MRELTVVLPYYINAGMLRKQYETFRALPEKFRRKLHLVIVDDGSPRDPAFVEDIGLDLKVYRITVDVRWNQDAARNLGVSKATRPWLLLTDIDHLIPEATIARCLEGKLNDKTVYKFSRVSAPKLDPYKPHPNSYLMHRKVWDHVGGYDEALAGYYGTDGDFRARVNRVAHVLDMREVLIRVPREVIPDASTTTYTRKDVQDHENLPRLLSARKHVPNWRPTTLSFPWVRVQ